MKKRERKRERKRDRERRRRRENNEYRDTNKQIERHLDGGEEELSIRDVTDGLMDRLTDRLPEGTASSGASEHL